MKTERKNEQKNFIWKKVLIILFWLLIWQIIAWIIDNKIILVGPIEVVKRLAEDIQTIVYYKTVGESVLRIMGGLLCGLVLAVVSGVVSWKKKWIEAVLLPLIQFLKAAPITCFVVLLLIWAGAENLAFFIALLVSFPPVYFNFLEGLKQLDEKQIEVAKVYRMPLKNRLRYIYLPGVKPYFSGAFTIAIGMAFKAGIAAEIIGTPDYSMGERIYMSKIYLDTAGVLSWMVTVIFVSYICEKICIKIMNGYFEKNPALMKNKKVVNSGIADDIIISDCSVAYDKEVVLSKLNAEFKAGKSYAITGESGIGKTTILKILWGLKKADAGKVCGNEEIRAGVFQENRLFEEYTAIENVFATGQCFMEKGQVLHGLQELLPEECLDKPVKEYSGGMKRRVEVARAMFADSGIILLDEPFAGLDEATKEKTINFIIKYKKGRTIIFTTHCLSDIQGVKAEEFKLWKTD